MSSGSTASTNSVVFGDGSGTIGGKVAIDYFKWSNKSPVVETPGDANSDGMVDVGDLGILAANYGLASGAAWAQGDFNGDGAVDVGDLGILAANYGTGTSGTDFNADYAKVFGTTAVASEDTSDDTTGETGSTICSSLGLSLIAGLLLACLTWMKLKEPPL
jgi:hypothetical protein